MKFDAIIFDLDGTLLDSIEDLADAANEMLVIHNFPVNGVSDYLSWVGDGVHELIRRALPDRNFDDTSLAGYVKEFKEKYAVRCLNKTRPYKGISDTLEKLKEKRIKLAVLSNKADNFTIKMVEAVFGKETFDIIFGERKWVPKKPQPDAALEIADKLKINPKKVLFVGDSPNDMKTARAAWMIPVGVLWGYRSEENLKLSGAKILINEPEELLAL